MVCLGRAKVRHTVGDDFWKTFGLLTSGFHVGGRYLPVLASGRMFKILSTLYFFLIMVSYRYCVLYCIIDETDTKLLFKRESQVIPDHTSEVP